MPPELLQVADKIGVLSGAFVLGWLLYTKRLIFGWQYKDCDDERKTLRDLASKRADKLETDLEHIRASRER